jgi:hypothetical protein
MRVSHFQNQGVRLKTRYLGFIAIGALLILSYTNMSPSNLGQTIKSKRPANSSAYSTENDFWAANRILVKAHEGASDKDINDELSKHGGRVKSEIRNTGIKIVELPGNANEKAIAALVKKNKNIEFAEVDQMVELSFIPNDPYYGSAWHLAKISAPTAWDISQGDGITIAILDTGVDSTHPDLASKLVPGYNIYDNNTNTTDVHGHGTKCAGAAAAISNNGIGVAGVAGNARIMPIRISGLDGWATWSAIASGITWAADHGAKIASISYQAHHGSSVLSASTYMKSKGGLVVNAAGNANTEEVYTNSNSIITVAATDSADNKASFSSFGVPVDISAPGVSIYLTVNGGGYGAASGTSFSTPITAGVIALMMSANPSLSNQQIESLLFSSANDLGTAGWDKYFGNGRVNAGAAVTAARAATPVVSDTTKPTVSITSAGGVVKDIFTVNVAASDNLNVSKVDLYINNKFIASDNLMPYSFAYDSKLLAEGANTLQAKAYDAAGNEGVSGIVYITVDNVIDSIAPTVVISSPLANAVVRNNVTISASTAN